ncbi:MAG: hypothetical protein HYY36_06180 [Gammaproteobacteria bacterium]|nr:hypothetical protein [Gammaproteobacteria bacterium]
MSNRALRDHPYDGLDDLEFDDDRLRGSGDDSTDPVQAAKRPLPAWRRIEEYREMRELNRQVQDDIYGTRPIRSLWEWDPV